MPKIYLPRKLFGGGGGDLVLRIPKAVAGAIMRGELPGQDEEQVETVSLSAYVNNKLRVMLARMHAIVSQTGKKSAEQRRMLTAAYAQTSQDLMQMLMAGISAKHSKGLAQMEREKGKLMRYNSALQEKADGLAYLFERMKHRASSRYDIATAVNVLFRGEAPFPQIFREVGARQDAPALPTQECKEEINKLTRMHLQREGIWTKGGLQVDVSGGRLWVEVAGFKFELVLCGAFESPTWKLLSVESSDVSEGRALPVEIMRIDGKRGSVAQLVRMAKYVGTILDMEDLYRRAKRVFSDEEKARPYDSQMDGVTRNFEVRLLGCFQIRFQMVRGLSGCMIKCLLELEGRRVFFVSGDYLRKIEEEVGRELASKYAGAEFTYEDGLRRGGDTFRSVSDLYRSHVHNRIRRSIEQCANELAERAGLKHIRKANIRVEDLEHTLENIIKDVHGNCIAFKFGKDTAAIFFGFIGEYLSAIEMHEVTPRKSGDGGLALHCPGLIRKKEDGADALPEDKGEEASKSIVAAADLVLLGIRAIRMYRGSVDFTSIIVSSGVKLGFELRRRRFTVEIRRSPESADGMFSVEIRSDVLEIEDKMRGDGLLECIYFLVAQEHLLGAKMMRRHPKLLNGELKISISAFASPIEILCSKGGRLDVHAGNLHILREYVKESLEMKRIEAITSGIERNRAILFRSDLMGMVPCADVFVADLRCSRKASLYLRGGEKGSIHVRPRGTADSGKTIEEILSGVEHRTSGKKGSWEQWVVPAGSAERFLDALSIALVEERFSRLAADASMHYGETGDGRVLHLAEGGVKYTFTASSERRKIEVEASRAGDSFREIPSDEELAELKKGIEARVNNSTARGRFFEGISNWKSLLEQTKGRNFSQ